ncbi:lipid II flippase Amj family protein [Tsuneonella sp. CC-YZS046]|uniref:lipid II flippase Amj family protein n=1 Tax=Tsuneonella sp. CC-YZS046 TaxID=3042152 RepID=UPI002D76E130|nr:lipid II flippase Amj family protein [Tsuneonella sp. CC-YZS046]WRO65258.1 lipid II flippase Amj family protein [Tsuneonella sp. CC-YZS046]
MDMQLAVICLLTFGINLIGALAYAARIAGVRTRRIAVSFALFNVLVLLSRLSNSFLGPFLAKRIENALAEGTGEFLLRDFRMILLSATIATIAGTLMIPTVQRWFCSAINDFQDHRSIPKLVMHAFARGGLGYIRRTSTAPRMTHVAELRKPRGISGTVIFLNVLAQALLTVGVVASLYAGYLYPEYRVTASQLSAVVNGFATILLFVLIDPQLSVMTDDVVAGNISEPMFRRTIVWLSLSRIAGTLLAQMLFLPAAWLVVLVAGVI